MKKKKCKCKRDEDGECQSCRKKVDNIISELGSVLLEFLQQMEDLPKRLKARIAEVDERHDFTVRDAYRNTWTWELQGISGLSKTSRKPEITAA